ncbi:MAG: RnfABCDGE type electron transport complex subunit G [Desulfarculaceae bacterium]|nr:RnfABCDGE type electron transport complex subunit G [Desulfarculaceae bacterium]MCF8047952.1 RnfABCDGE type electron transport complex subunit G [Desulfarculaceae bacterium]MCF8065334.1 RnfABCDGE type electron transport complex subunit G [Desulfarculaceae bacterium]MCF8099573.1 RnfABCDGE type electron transport complex subunit G [Desulfarculaceae bacterium]
MRDILKMLVVLTVICAASGFLLALVHDVTKDPIEYSRLKFVKEPAVKAVLSGYQNDPIKDRLSILVGKDKKGKPVNLIVFPAKKDGKTFAVAFESTGSGYHGDIGVMLGVDLASKKLTGMSIVSHTETPGLGARIIEPSFTDSFKGKPMDKELATGDINALSGATLSTKGVVAAVNKAQATLNKYRDKMVQ